MTGRGSDILAGLPGRLATESLGTVEAAVVDAARWLEAASALKAAGFTMLVELAAADYQGHPDPHPGRFAVVAHFMAAPSWRRAALKAYLDGAAPAIASLCPLYDSANWFEREAFDMYGIAFEGHPDPRRLLMYDGFEGHPLRKDYPLDRMQPRLPMRQPVDWAERLRRGRSEGGHAL